MADNAKMNGAINGRVVVIGLDGGTFAMLDPLMERGLMPNLKKIVESGTAGELQTVIPPVTPAAWSTFMTGKNPGKHGILGFLVKDEEGETPVNSRLRRAKTIWRLVNEAGGKVISLSIPTTYPPERVDGFMVGSFLTPRGNKDYAYPPELIEDIENRFGPYRLYINEVYTPRRISILVNEAREDVKYKFRVARYLADKIDWRLLAVHIFGTDRVQHELWHLTDPSHPLHKPRETERHGDELLGFYSSLDDEMGALLSTLDPADTVYIMSDHGFGPVYKFLNFNPWLLERGYMKLRRSPFTFIRKTLYDLGAVPKNAYRLFMRLGLARLRLSIGINNRKRFFSKVNYLVLSMRDVDWSRTVAYSRGYYGEIFLNLKGREPCGIVEPSDYEAVRGEIVRELKSIRDPETGKPVIGPVYRPEDLYHGPYTGNAADIIFLPEDMSYKAIGTADFTSNKVMEKAYANSGDHRLNGIFIARGPHVKKGARITGARIDDLAPTILHSLGLPVVEDMDGRVLTGIFEPSFMEQNPVRYEAPRPDEIGADESGYSDDEKDAVKGTLKDLGYI